MKNSKIITKKLDCGLTEVSIDLESSFVKITVDEKTGKIRNCNTDDPCIVSDTGVKVWTDEKGDIIKI